MKFFLSSASICLFILLLTVTVVSDVNSQNWEAAASQPFQALGRHHPVAFTIDGVGYMGTGASSAGLLDDFYSYNPETDSWQILNDFSGSARSFAYGLSYNGKGYLGFGVTSVGEENDLWEYDPASDSWRELASCPCTPRTHPAMVLHEGIIYVGLGGSEIGNLKDWWAYDIAADRWDQKPDYPSNRRHHPYHFAIGDYVYVAFGHGEGIYNDLYRFDPADDSWQQMASLPSEGRVAGTQFAYNGKGYVLSGDGDDHGPMTTGEFWEYDPILDEWTSLPPHPGIASRWAPGSFVIDGEVFFIGGLEAGSLMTNTYKFDLAPINSGILSTELETFDVYPNPVADFISLELTENILDYQIINHLGQSQAIKNSTTNRLDVTHLNDGQYVIIASSVDKKFVSKFIKK
jgi:N-acetylneuraminic acid mutarotase